MKALSYMWRVVINLITILIILAMFSVVSTDFETIVLSGLVLIYLSITGFTALWGLSHMEFAQSLGEEIRDIKRLINKKELAEYQEKKRILPHIENEELDLIEKDENNLAEREKSKKTLMTKFYINVGFQFIMYLIALFNLLTAL